MGICEKDIIIKNIIFILAETGPITSKEVIEKVRRIINCSTSPTLIREALADLVRKGLVHRVPGPGNKNVLVFQASPHALDAIQ